LNVVSGPDGSGSKADLFVDSQVWLSETRRWAKQYAALGDDELRATSRELAFELREHQEVKKVLPRGFALVQNAAQRTLGMAHYDVQFMGGRGMALGQIVEMRTGEGKTLTAVLPLYLHALLGKGALLATANDYLARRDAEWMGPVYRLLGLSIGVIQTEMQRDERRRAYAADITYGTMKEFGFDFLRDHSMGKRQRDAELWFGHRQSHSQTAEAVPVQRTPYYLLVDEADSILIDDARTPLILSAAPDPDAKQRQLDLYRWSAEVAPQCIEDEHYLYDKEKRRVELSTVGTAFIRSLVKPQSLAGTGLLEMYESIERAIQVYRDYKLDRDYVIREGEIVIVDEATGRVSPGRRWSRGIHQAIEAKEQVEVTLETRTEAKITVQAYVNRYPVIGGMTGTAFTSAREFRKVYRTPVRVIPPNRPSKRNALPEIVCPDESSKWEAVVAEISQVHSQGRPVLVGTRSIAKSEILAHHLRAQGIAHQVLNANHVEREAEIVSQAGQLGRVTVATNMAGRGTDIQISDECKELGGLHVIGTELHESARIDLQLFGRCARQGDPGTIRQFIAYDDQLLEAAHGTARANWYRKIGKLRGTEWWVKLFRKAQEKVESRHYRARKILMYNEAQLAKTQKEMGLDPILDHLD
jgi:preprotein translocase subunit SecA